MKILSLSLSKEWFEMTEKLIKLEDYQEITPYWCAIFLVFSDGTKTTRAFWKEAFAKRESKDIFNRKVDVVKYYLAKEKVKFKNYSINKMTKGYPGKTDTKRIINLVNEGIEIGTGKSEWGAEPDTYCFVIKHGNFFKNNKRF